MSLFGGVGGPRFASSRLDDGTRHPTALDPPLTSHVLIGVTSSLIGLAAFKPEIVPGEWESWARLRPTTSKDLKDAFASVPANRRIILFCHDPTALPLWLRNR